MTACERPEDVAIACQQGFKLLDVHTCIQLVCKAAAVDAAIASTPQTQTRHVSNANMAGQSWFSIIIIIITQPAYTVSLPKSHQQMQELQAGLNQVQQCITPNQTEAVQARLGHV